MDGRLTCNECDDAALVRHEHALNIDDIGARDRETVALPNARIGHGTPMQYEVLRARSWNFIGVMRSTKFRDGEVMRYEGGSV